jgi:putative hydrolase of the HAD superfamily
VTARGGRPGDTAGAAPLSGVRHWLIDLDDTLYPASSGLFAHVSRRITERMSALLGLPFEEARAVQKRYWRRYGTSLRGLIVEHGVDPEPFLAYVHDVPVEEVLAPEPGLRATLAALPGARHIFTNGPAEFAHRVLLRLDVDDLFERVFDIRHAQFVPKPDPQPYRLALEALGVPGEAVAMVDDSPQNLARARALGMVAIWLRSPHSMAGGSTGSTVALVEEAPEGERPHLIIDRLEELRGLVIGSD